MIGFVGPVTISQIHREAFKKTKHRFCFTDQ